MSSSYIKDGHYTKHKDYLRQSVLQWTKGKPVDKRKTKKRKCRRLPTWGSTRCKVNFSSSCQLVYHSVSLLIVTKMPPVVSAVSIYPYLNKENIYREKKDKGSWRQGERENKKDIIHALQLYAFIHCWSVEQCSSSCECMQCRRVTSHWFHKIHEPPLLNYFTRQWYLQWVTQPVQYCYAGDRVQIL